MGQNTKITTHKQIDQTSIRTREESVCYQGMLRLIATFSLMRTSITEVLPTVGSASWWITPLLIVPGLIVYLTSRSSMRKAKTSSCHDWMLKSMGQAGGCITAAAFTLLVLSDSVLSLNVLTSFFSNIIGVAGTPFEIALVTCIAVMLCLDRKGLPRAISLLRWGMCCAGIVIIINEFDLLSVGSLYPIMGDGALQPNQILLLSGKMSWPILVMLLDEQTEVPKKKVVYDLSMLLVCGCWVLLMNLIVPHEIWMSSNAFADTLMHLRVWFHQGIRTIASTLVIQAWFLLFASEICVCVAQASSLFRQEIRWLPYVIVICCAFTQLGNSINLSSALGWFQCYAYAGIASLFLTACVLTWWRRKC